MNFLNIPTVDLDDQNHSLVLLDQTLLPNETVVLRLQNRQDIFEAIQKLRVRGAPAIGVAAAIALYLAVKNGTFSCHESFFRALSETKAYYSAARPTAVNLFWALDRMENTAKNAADKPIAEIIRLLREEALLIRDQDIESCKKIGENGLTLLSPGMGILTHCNAGRLAAVRYGTATAPIYLGEERGYHFHVYADETRPLLQGARLTAYELTQSGIDVTLLCDNMASYAMQKGLIDAVLVGCDRVALNGDTANKIGTSGVAVLAQYYHIPFYVCAPYSTVDFSCPDGGHIPVEQRSADEVTQLWYEKPMAPSGISVLNPAFDVTPHSLITAFITDRGVIRPPFEVHFKEKL